jgi:hypothetical protein
MKRGYRCMCVTDHSYGLPIAGGMKMDEMREQHAEINKLNKKFGGEFRVFKGVEANILQDGSLDMDPAELTAGRRLSAFELAQDPRSNRTDVERRLDAGRAHPRPPPRAHVQFSCGRSR